MTSYETQVRYSETGAEGVAYHGHYYSWFDMVQHAFLEKHGLSYQQLIDTGIRFSPIDVHSRYFAPAHFGDRLCVSMRVVSLSNVKAVLAYKITRKADNALVAECTIAYAALSAEFRPLVLKLALPKLHAALAQEKDEDS